MRSDHARALAEHDVNLVICAGISREVGNALRAQGIEVIGKCGAVDEVVDAYLACGLDDGRFVMPGGWNNHQEWCAQVENEGVRMGPLRVSEMKASRCTAETRPPTPRGLGKIDGDARTA